MTASRSREPYRFGDFTFDPIGGRLEQCGRVVALPHQPAKVLELLLANAGTLVTREEMIAAVWGDGTTVVYADGLNFCIRQIRQALGESARDPVLIETFPKRGYRFSGPVLRGSRPAAARAPLMWTRAAALATLLAIAAVSAPSPISPLRPRLSGVAGSGPITPLLSATLRHADIVLRFTVGSIEAHLLGGDCPWPRYLASRRPLI